MTHENTEIIQTLKAARETKGISQRALSERIGVPQSHISKIENNGVDIQLSSLIQLARALDFEVKLVPKKSLTAVESILRSVYPETTHSPRPAYTLEDDDG